MPAYTVSQINKHKNFLRKNLANHIKSTTSRNINFEEKRDKTVQYIHTGEAVL